MNKLYAMINISIARYSLTKDDVRELSGARLDDLYHLGYHSEEHLIEIVLLRIY